MRFRLKFVGILGGQNTKDVRKHEIREQFHPQFKNLWAAPPLNEYLGFLRFPEPDRPLGFFRQVGTATFCPLVCEAWGLLARIDILMLRRERPGRIFSSGADLDNQLKVLIDALRMPSISELTRSGCVPSATPAYCLLEDDSAVEALAVQTDRLLTDGDPGQVEAILDVRVRQVRPTVEGSGLSG